MTTLVLKNNAVDYVAAVSLADNMKGNRCLTSLDLSDNNIGSEGATAIAHNLGNLRYLYLSNNKIGLTGTLKLHLGKLDYLDLSNNHIHDEDAVGQTRK